MTYFNAMIYVFIVHKKVSDLEVVIIPCIYIYTCLIAKNTKIKNSLIAPDAGV